jgi:acyl-CoA reductase-like NAD-dependent aldehyde dehydrogenase
MAYQSINPFNAQVLQSFDTMTDAQACFQTWKNTSFAQRAVILNKAAGLMHARVDEFAKLATLEMSRRIDETRGEVKVSGDMLAYYAELAATFLAPTKPAWPGRNSWQATRWWSSTQGACPSALSRSRNFCWRLARPKGPTPIS